MSPRRAVPDTIPKPDYALDGIPRSEQKFIGKYNVKILNEQEIAGMRKVCRLAREVLDIVAAAAKPGVTTDQLDKICHDACVERNVRIIPCPFLLPMCTGVDILTACRYHSRIPRPLTTSISPSPSALPLTRSSATVSPTSAPWRMAISSISMLLCTTRASTAT